MSLLPYVYCRVFTTGHFSRSMSKFMNNNDARSNPIKKVFIADLSWQYVEDFSPHYEPYEGLRTNYTKSGRSIPFINPPLLAEFL
ncbi:MAG: hypothetical protein ACRC62_11140 [Microcoleus sp.]